jgi:chemotaxis protein MotB
MKRNYFLLLILAVALFEACIPARKYEELEAKSKACETSLKSSRDSLRKFTESSAEINRELTELKKSNAVLVRDTALLGSSYRQQREQYNLINDLNKEIRAQLELLRKGSEADAQKLNSQLQMTQYELQKKEDELRILEKDLNAKKLDLDAKQKRIDELEALLKKQADAAEALRAKVADALTSFKDKGLTVVEKDGKVYVSMESKLLFATGSYAVDKGGQEILIKLAKVLETQSDLEIVVEGHTDTDKLNSQNTPKDNWELSVLRATSVTKIMLENSKMDNKKITAAGRSEYIPVDPTDKAKNRRIEIILMPNLDELYKLIEGK